MELFDSLTDKHRKFISDQHLFFVATAGAEGRVNLSPKGLDSLRVLDQDAIQWLNLTGSGNETAAHVLENQRMTIMFCSFAKQPLILRLYGHAEMIATGDKRWSESLARFPHQTGARQIFLLNIELVQTSCGYAVPHYEFIGERETLSKWADKKTEQELRDYQLQKNAVSLDGKETGISER